MKFSILVPVYNVEQYIEQCLESILYQTYQDFELILVDDGSVDSSGKICDAYAARFPTKVKVIHKENQGLISARRIGIKAASGEFCVFVDSDDFIELNLLETLEKYINKDMDVDILLYSFRYYRDGKIAERFHAVAEDGKIWDEEEKKELYYKLITSSLITSIWSKAIRTSVLKEDMTDYTQYYSKNMAEDLLQSLYPMTKARKIMYTDHVLYNYRINNESSSRSYYYKTISNKNTVHVYEKIKEYLPTWNMKDKETLEALNARWFHEVMYTLIKYYESAVTNEDKEKVLSFDWDSMLPLEARNLENEYFNQKYKELYSLLKQGKKFDIRKYFWRRKWYQRIKNWKRKLHS